MNADSIQENTEASRSADMTERQSPGALIRRARERARLAPEELAAQTKLARNVLDALERDDFNTLSEPVYIRGYYRKCAKVLEIPERELLNAYETRVAPRAPSLPAKLRLASGTELGTGSRLPVSLAAMGAVGAVIICALIWFARGEPSNTVPPAVSAKADAMTPEAVPAPAAPQPASAPAPAVVEAAPTPTAPAPAPAANPSPYVLAMPAAQPAPVPAPQPAVTPAPAPTPTSVPAVKPAVPAPAPVAAVPAKPVTGAITLSLAFSITSWARVDDASGKTLLNGLMRSGDKQNLAGLAPFTVFLGNAPGVRATVNGKSVDLAKYTAANNTARFTLSGN